MLSKLGIVSNIWASRMAAGDRFEDLMELFNKNGFKYMEIRDGDYLRQSEFGRFLSDIEKAMGRYTDDQWMQICDTIQGTDDLVTIIETHDRRLFQRVQGLLKRKSDVEISYAMAHTWMSRPEDTAFDNSIIIQAKKLAYLLCPSAARLRLVDPEYSGDVDADMTVSNLQRYRTLLEEFPVILAVENSKPSATVTLDVTVQGGVKLAYDEANTYNTDGEAINPPEAFWDAVAMDVLTSVHIKQKTADGVTPVICDGFVDFKAIFKRLKAGGYDRDLLLENAPSDDPLADAIESREYLSNLDI